MTYQAPDPRIAIMDWKLASQAFGSAGKPVCYRWECLSCEWFRRNMMGGLVVDGQRQKEWWCVLIDDRKEPCKIKDELSARINPPPKRAAQTQPAKAQQPRSGDNQTGEPLLQQRLPSPLVPSNPGPYQRTNPQPKPALPNLPMLEGSEAWRRAQKRAGTAA